MKPTLREILADSHISAVAIAALLLLSLDWGFRALWGPFSRVAGFLFNAIAIFGIPYFSLRLDSADRLILITTITYLFSALISLAAAWLLSRWVYGVGPLRILSTYRTRLTRRNHA